MTLATLKRKTDMENVVCLLCLDSITGLVGRKLRDVFVECESCGATVYWGFWSETELDSKITL